MHFPTHTKHPLPSRGVYAPLAGVSTHLYGKVLHGAADAPLEKPTPHHYRARVVAELLFQLVVLELAGSHARHHLTGGINKSTAFQYVPHRTALHDPRRLAKRRFSVCRMISRCMHPQQYTRRVCVSQRKVKQVVKANLVHRFRQATTCALLHTPIKFKGGNNSQRNT